MPSSSDREHTHHDELENTMRSSVIFRNAGLMIVFAAVGFTMFTENVRTVQILGLFASGAVFGVGLTRIVDALRGRKG